MKWLRVSLPVVSIACSVLLAQADLRAQTEQSAAQSPAMRLEVRFPDQAAASSKAEYRVHIRPAKGQGTGHYSPLAATAPGLEGQTPSKIQAATPEALAVSSVPEVPAPGFYPADLSNLGGPLVTSAENHPVFVDCPESCWGAPINFLNHLVKSQFLHVVDQYIGTTANNRYTVGKSAAISFPVGATLGDNDVIQIAHAAAAALGSGYDHIYHIFLPKGVDICFTGTTQCYSPDNLSTFAFCAYHASVTFSDIGHVLFTVEPYQNVSGCSVRQPSPNGALIDSTSSTLSHETIETITDPDPPTGWVAISSGGVLGQEIGDLCTGVDLDGHGANDPVISIFGKKYEVQPEYSNRYHACSFVP